jgi:DNA-binding XRE family transcriptional regulator
MLDDISAYDEAMAATDEETLPHEMVRRLVEGEPPVRVWREHRGLAQRELAERVGIQKAYLSQIESGRRVGSIKVLAGLAAILEVAIEDLLEDLPKAG